MLRFDRTFTRRTGFVTLDRLLKRLYANKAEFLKEQGMKFYDCTTAPSPRRVRIFLAEKCIKVPTVQVDLRNGEQFSEAFRRINPDCTVPVLALDDGTRITDAVAICVYFEGLQPDIGRDLASRARIIVAQRRAEREGFFAAQRSAISRPA